MPSDITNTLSAYRQALDVSQERYELMYEQRSGNAQEFYYEFFRNLIRDYSQLFEDPAGRRQVKRLIEQFFATSEVRFAAIDGTCYKDAFGDYMVFFGAAYAVRGEVSFLGEPPTTKYEKWAPEQDVSLVAYVPIPFAEISDVAEEQFRVASDTERLDLTSIHTQLMQLAEIYLAYDLASTTTVRPKVILWDHSMSSVMASSEVGVFNVDMVGYPHLGRRLNRQDIVIGYSHPYNTELIIPSKKQYRIYNYVLKRLYDQSPLTLSDLAVEIGIDTSDLRTNIDNYLLKSLDDGNSITIFNEDSGQIFLREEYQDTWRYLVNLFENFCTRLYKDKDQSALIYRKEIDGEYRDRWLTPNDFRFLIAIGLRALVEQCWRNNILLIGIAKDSSSKYLSRNYLGVLRELNQYEFQDILLPWTDRTFLEVLPFVDDSLQSPWCTIEFDSVFMTLAYRESKGGGEYRIQGVHGDVVGADRLFMRSLGQFYLNRLKDVPLTGHVIFIDRLIMPIWDRPCLQEISINEARLGHVQPFAFLRNDNNNYCQDVSMFLLDTLTKNLYPEVIGYPDPLHKADWGAKSLLNKVKAMIQASGFSLKSRPLVKTFRRIRDSIRRT